MRALPGPGPTGQWTGCQCFSASSSSGASGSSQIRQPHTTPITAELCANAVQHGFPGQDFHVRLAADTDGRRLRVEVSATRAERRPAATVSPDLDTASESCRGPLLLADDWGVTDHRGGPAKTVWVVVGAAPGPSGDATPVLQL